MTRAWKLDYKNQHLQLIYCHEEILCHLFLETELLSVMNWKACATSTQLPDHRNSVYTCVPSPLYHCPPHKSSTTLEQVPRECLEQKQTRATDSKNNPVETQTYISQVLELQEEAPRYFNPPNQILKPIFTSPYSKSIQDVTYFNKGKNCYYIF